MRLLVTGAAGFIGANLCRKLLDKGHQVVGLDNLNDYYDVTLKKDRLRQLRDMDGFVFYKQDICDQSALMELFYKYHFDRVIHLAAQAGVRYSIENPTAYFQANLLGFGHVLEACREQQVNSLIYASSSSIYGANKNFPFKETDRVDHPVSLYAATKKANELMAHSYSELYDLQTIGLRFFTVYGPWGRPDMAAFRFAARMLEGHAISVYNNGEMVRDFTYIDDITEGVLRVIEQPISEPYHVFNIGRGEPVQLMDFIRALEVHLGVTAHINYLPMQDGDVPRTMASTESLYQIYGYSPQVSLDQGVARFAQWYKSYFQYY